jgi:predicted transcriptional regulator
VIQIDNPLITLTANIVAAHVSNHNVAVSDMAQLITNTHGALAGLGSQKPLETAKQQPAVAIRNSINPDYIICLEDGKRYKMLKNHLMTAFGMTPKEYRAKWNLPADYPMVAPNYAAARSAIAYKIGLGRKHGKRKKA